MRVSDSNRSRWANSIKEQYQVGTRVVLDYTDSDTQPPIGTEGVVVDVNSHGTVFVSWDNYGTTAILFELGDSIRKV